MFLVCFSAKDIAIYRVKIMQTKSLSKYQQIAKELKESISSKALKPGCAIPTHRELIDRYQVSAGTIRQALSRLESEGWVRSEHGRGVFVNGNISDGKTPKSLRKSMVGFAVLGSYSGVELVDQLFLNSVTEHVQESGKHVLFGTFDPISPEGIAQFETFLSRVSKVIVSQWINNDVLELLRQWEGKAVILGHVPDSSASYEDFSYVLGDMEGVGYMAAQMLAIYNHKKIAFVVGQTPGKSGELEPVAPRRAMLGMRRACDEYGMEFESFFSTSESENVDIARKIAEKNEVTGIVSHSCRFGYLLHNVLQAKGLVVGEDKSIVCAAGIPDPHSLIKLSLVRVGCGVMATEAAKLLLDDSLPIVHKVVPSTFEKGQTLGFAK